MLTTDPQPILHVKMQLLVCAGSTGIKFVKTDETKNAAIYTLSSSSNPLTGSIYSYKNVTCVQPATYTLCPPPKINSFSPAVISAGTGSILTIKGIGFGTVRGKGQVQFREANNGGATTVPYMNALTDYVSWKDNEIKVRIPSSVDTLNQVGHPGSGDFVVKRDDGLTAATNSLPPPVLKINYSVLDLIIGTPGTKTFAKIPFQHIDATNSITGDVREFYLDTSIANNPNMNKIVRKALRDWTCATGINWRIAGVVTQQGLVPDGKSIIYLDNSYTGSPLAATKSTDAATCVDAGSGQEFVYYKETDIAITRKFLLPLLNSWFFDTTLTQNVPLNKYDFYAVILHELGHAHYLGHVNTDDDLMYYGSTIGPVQAANRLHIKRSEDATEGGVYTLMASQAINNKNCLAILPALRIFPSNCPNAGLTEEASDIKSIYLYPNPSEETINLSFKLTANSSVSYTVYDVSGKIILHQEMGDLSTGTYDKKIDLTSIATGAYVLTVRFDDRSESVRLIKQ